MKMILLSLLICNQSFGQGIVQQLDSLMLKNFPADRPGAVLMVAENGKVLYQKGFGLTSVDSKEKNTAATNFRMASVSKQFTAMCIMLLVKQQKISYEDNLIKFFPGWNKKVGQKITIRHLLTHSSGIWGYESLIPDDQQKQISDADVVSYLLHKDSTYFEPGIAFQYSNSGFCVLEQIVEMVSGLSYQRFIEQNIFKPLEMHHTRVFQAGEVIPNRAMGFAVNEKNVLVESDQSITSATKGDGCVYTSINDYQKWASSLINNTLVNIGDQLKLVNKAVNGTKNVYYGQGWFNALDNNGDIELYHTGSTCGFSNVVKIVPKDKLIIAFFSNIAGNHKAFYEAEVILKKYHIDRSEIEFKKILDLTR